MTTHVLFIHGAGKGAYEADKQLAASLQKSLGSAYEVNCPALPDEENAPYDQWTQVIEQQLAALPAPVILVGHSVGGSLIAKWFSELKREMPVASVILISTPFWGGDGGWTYEGYQALELPEGAGEKLPKDVSITLYHARDDETVPFDHLALYARAFPQASVREVEKGGHQFNDDLSVVAQEIKRLR